MRMPPRSGNVIAFVLVGFKILANTGYHIDMVDGLTPLIDAICHRYSSSLRIGAFLCSAVASQRVVKLVIAAVG